MERIFVDQARLSVSNVSGETSSQLSDFVEWVFPCLVNLVRTLVNTISDALSAVRT